MGPSSSVEDHSNHVYEPSQNLKMAKNVDMLPPQQHIIRYPQSSLTPQIPTIPQYLEVCSFFLDIRFQFFNKYVLVNNSKIYKHLIISKLCNLVDQ